MEKNLIKILAITIVLFFVINLTIDFVIKKLPDSNYLYLPFPITLSSCYSESSCRTSLILWGIIASIAYWIIMILLVHNLISKKLEEQK